MRAAPSAPISAGLGPRPVFTGAGPAGARFTAFLAGLAGGFLAAFRMGRMASNFVEFGFRGTRAERADTNAVGLHFLGKTFRGQFLLVDGWHGVLGRNILNNLSILFDGPSQKWMERR